jgi:hypothetical protein
MKIDAQGSELDILKGRIATVKEENKIVKEIFLS